GKHRDVPVGAVAHDKGHAPVGFGHARTRDDADGDESNNQEAHVTSSLLSPPVPKYQTYPAELFSSICIVGPIPTSFYHASVSCFFRDGNKSVSSEPAFVIQAAVATISVGTAFFGLLYLVSESDSKRAQQFEGLARRLVKCLIWATRSQATSVEAAPSKSLA